MPKKKPINKVATTSICILYRDYYEGELRVWLSGWFNDQFERLTREEFEELQTMVAKFPNLFTITEMQEE